MRARSLEFTFSSKFTHNLQWVMSAEQNLQIGKILTKTVAMTTVFVVSCPKSQQQLVKVFFMTERWTDG